MPGWELPVDDTGAVDAPLERVLRIKSISITNFRGIKELRNLDVDADIVLLAGPNGFGKTSFIDALCLLLTGHHYYGNDPKTLLFMENGKNVGPAVIKAEVELLRKSGVIVKREIQVQVPVKYPEESIVHYGFYPNNESIQPEINARASFYYQELLRELFDEGTPGTTLKEFLVPVEKDIVDIPKKIKPLERKLADKEKQLLDIKGVPSEEEIDRQRKQAVRQFTNAWHAIGSVAEEYGVSLPQRSENWLFMLKSDNLRQGWKGELRKLVNDCIESLDIKKMELLPVDANPLNSLQCLWDLFSRIRKKIEEALVKHLEEVEQAKRLLSSLPPGYGIPKQDELPAAKQAIKASHQELKELRDRLAVVAEVHNCYNRTEGPTLLDILKSLRENSTTWLNNAARLNAWHMPEPVIKWLRTASENLFTEKYCLDEVFGEWLSHIEKQRSALEKAIQAKEQTVQREEEYVSKIETIYELAARSEKVRVLVEKTTQTSEAGESAQTVGHIPEESQLREDPITKMETAIIEWIGVEKLAIEREDTIRKTKGADEARQIINEVREAIKKESSKKTSLLESMVELPVKETERLAQLINDIFFRFRAVKGLYPVKLERRQQGNGRTRKDILSVKTWDDRPFEALSTGQKAQLALSFLMSLNISLAKLLRHNIIGLDDTTTALDMAQLPREAVLLRQIAYGAEIGYHSLESRRQLFIVSHHEDLTHRLIDFLIPPNGRNLCILNFVDWKPGKGPEIEQYKVEAANAVDHEARKKIAEQVRFYVQSMKGRD